MRHTQSDRQMETDRETDKRQTQTNRGGQLRLLVYITETCIARVRAETGVGAGWWRGRAMGWAEEEEEREVTRAVSRQVQGQRLVDGDNDAALGCC